MRKWIPKIQSRIPKRWIPSKSNMYQIGPDPSTPQGNKEEEGCFVWIVIGILFWLLVMSVAHWSD